MLYAAHDKEKTIDGRCGLCLAVIKYIPPPNRYIF